MLLPDMFPRERGEKREGGGGRGEKEEGGGRGRGRGEGGGGRVGRRNVSWDLKHLSCCYFQEKWD